MLFSYPEIKESGLSRRNTDWTLIGQFLLVYPKIVCCVSDALCFHLLADVLRLSQHQRYARG